MEYKEWHYPQLEIDLDKLEDNLRALKSRMDASGIRLAGVVKGFNGLPWAARIYERVGYSSIASSRLEQLHHLRMNGIAVPLMLIRIPMMSEVEETARWTDISLHSEPEVLRAMERAVKATAGKRRHKVILMVDLGDLREGFWDQDELVQTALEVEREMPHLELAGVGTNLGCYGTVQATPEKMNQLVAVAERVEAAIGRKLDIISGGASSSIRMVLDGTMPPRINHLRVGEGILFGRIWGCDMDFMHKHIFTLRAEVIESKVKPSYPVGELSVDAFGRTRTYVDRGRRRRALLAMGRVDYGECEDLIPREPGVKILGASSDHTIVDVQNTARPVQVGDILEFDLCYATMVYLTSSRSVSVTFKTERG